MVMPRAFSSGAASISSYLFTCALPVFARTLVIAAVNEVLPWSTWPIVPMFTCGLLRSNFAFPMVASFLKARKLESRIVLMVSQVFDRVDAQGRPSYDRIGRLRGVLTLA